jgi:membrane complex biogenesis BtpA family protein
MMPRKKRLFGMLHVPPLPGSPRSEKNIEAIKDFVLADALTLQKGGVDGFFIENYGDLPFFPNAVPPITIASLSVIAHAVRREIPLELGINVLRNDGKGALAIAQAVGAGWVRVNVLTGARLTDQGIIEGNAHELLRYRKKIDANHIQILADVSVKCSSSLSDRTLEAEVEETITRSGAEGLIVTGASTGKSVVIEELKQVKDTAKQFPVWIGSGVTEENISELLSYADGFIVGTAFKDRIEDPVNGEKVKRLVEKFQEGAFK